MVYTLFHLKIHLVVKLQTKHSYINQLFCLNTYFRSMLNRSYLKYTLLNITHQIRHNSNMIYSMTRAEG